jgi:activator of HSP90 ATPase
MEFIISTFIKASPEQVYGAWLNSAPHSKMTGGEAECTDKIGDSFTAWDGYIWGKNFDLVPNKTIIQTWRTSEFSDSEEDSMLNISLNSVDNGTEITLTHTNLPAHGMQYKQGWVDNYFTPMKEYFGH